MSSIGILLSRRDRYYIEGYSARLHGFPITAYVDDGNGESMFFGAFLKAGWEQGWRDADLNRQDPQPVAAAQPPPARVNAWFAASVIAATLCVCVHLLRS